ncbi:MAG: hypothetical protein COU06_00195 [Candidatus Harrisonbacteria bacterium CG10_big_fil_rev_8_21_14_0_10_38_8]|uniref:Uncharacterized protein n=1 Tax=Candidatus Harrisonbacteria bacterium CG10_big_fil_rev_8_21_14_0_10_38_8 TaxID=1974582 RepID=A0A2M6WKP9_9BACT|nr:MAG: hypothetical protein COU06_00195 [Candidatus Harrisonbacteria bacterium CG10_big_fil_rev_8_21_14_0_10_38_8]
MINRLREKTPNQKLKIIIVSTVVFSLIGFILWLPYLESVIVSASYQSSEKPSLAETFQGNVVSSLNTDFTSLFDGIKGVYFNVFNQIKGAYTQTNEINIE